MPMQVRSVAAARGWFWIAEGFRLFLRSPLQWVVVILVLFAAKKALSLIAFPGLAVVLSLLAMLLMPVFVAGLMDGCRSLDEGGRLQVTHLAQGFRKNAGQLVTIGGVSLVGNLIIVMVMIAMSGDAMKALVKTLSENPTITPQIAEQMQVATLQVAKAALVGATLSLPLLMALWFAPLLVYFDDAGAFAALKASFLACARNALPMLVYTIVLFVVLMVLAPVGIKFREYDLALWLMAPVLVPSVYASYKDIFRDEGSGSDVQR